MLSEYSEGGEIFVPEGHVLYNTIPIKTTGFIEALLEWRASGGKKWSELFATPEQLLSAGTSFEEQAKIIDKLSGEGV